MRRDRFAFWVGLISLMVASAAVGVEAQATTLSRVIPRHSPGGRDPAVQDFCHDVQRASRGVWQRERLVIFDVDGAELSEQPELQEDAQGRVLAGVVHHVFQRARVHEHVRQVFLAYFPLRRFKNVFAGVPSPRDLGAEVSSEAMIGAAANDAFAAYSLACADWVMLPHVLERNVKWRQTQKRRHDAQGRTIEYLAWDPQVTFRLGVDVYKREADQWRRVAALEGSNGGLFGGAASLAASALEGPEAGSASPNVSARPEPTCKIPVVTEAAEVLAGIERCASASEAAARSVASLQLDRLVPDPERLGARVSERVSRLQTEAEALSPEEVARFTLQSAQRGHDPGTLARIAGLSVAELGDEVDPDLKAEVSGVVGAAKGAVTTCQNSVRAISRAADALRALARGPSVDMLLGFAGCAGIPIKIDLGAATPIGSGQRHHEACSEGADAVGLGMGGMAAAAICQGRLGVERATLYVQRETKRVPGISLSDALTRCHSHTRATCFHLGAAEGLQRGDKFKAVTLDRTGQVASTQFGSVRAVGPGGEQGQQELSDLSFRTEEPAENTTVIEHPQVGVVLGARPQLSLLTSRGVLQTSLAYGAGLEGGYNATRFVGIADEVWSRVVFSYLAGSRGERFINVDLLPEATYYLGSRWALITGVGVSYAIASVAEGYEGPESWSASSFGALFGLGADHAFSPDWNARLMVAYRQGLSSTQLTTKSGRSADAGTLSSLQVALSAAYVF